MRMNATKNSHFYSNLCLFIKHHFHQVYIGGNIWPRIKFSFIAFSFSLSSLKISEIQLQDWMHPIRATLPLSKTISIRTGANNLVKRS